VVLTQTLAEPELQEADCDGYDDPVYHKHASLGVAIWLVAFLRSVPGVYNASTRALWHEEALCVSLT